MTTDPLDYDAGDRLLELLVRGECSFRQNLVAAARKAGQQLEFLKPSTMMVGRHGFAGGPVAQVERGTVLIVLANARRVFTAHLRMPPAEAGFTRLDYISVCPALVGLTGRASSGKAGHSSGVWPLLLPLAPYVEAFVAAAER